jgi:hypothetical protein
MVHGGGVEYSPFKYFVYILRSLRVTRHFWENSEGVRREFFDVIERWNSNVAYELCYCILKKLSGRVCFVRLAFVYNRHSLSRPGYAETGWTNATSSSPLSSIAINIVAPQPGCGYAPTTHMLRETPLFPGRALSSALPLSCTTLLRKAAAVPAHCPPFHQSMHDCTLERRSR